MPQNEMYTQAEACKYLGVTRQGLFYARKNGLLKGERRIGQRIIVFAKADLDAYKKIMRSKSNEHG